MTFQELAKSISLYFESNGLSKDGLIVILNISDHSAAVHLDDVIQHEFARLLAVSRTQTHMELSKTFEVNGVRFKIESPIHDQN